MLQARTGDLDEVEGGGLAGSAFLVLVLVLRERNPGAGNAGGARNEREGDRVAELGGLERHMSLQTQIGSASCRARACQYVYISGVAVELKTERHNCHMTYNS